MRADLDVSKSDLEANLAVERLKTCAEVDEEAKAQAEADKAEWEGLEKELREGNAALAQEREALLEEKSVLRQTIEGLEEANKKLKSLVALQG
ncbi:unnamed protein product [Linum trigynum]|uniref:Uncharacterized protein n=1 Tax=Linum trigynum TaxID=586398 RepID=A0AAV2DYA9_9ROSI